MRKGGYLPTAQSDLQQDLSAGDSQRVLIKAPLRMIEAEAATLEFVVLGRDTATSLPIVLARARTTD